MIDLHYWTSPNAQKITIFLEESGLPYRIVPVNIGKKEQLEAEFLKISPNGKIPAIVDHAPSDGGAPISIFESGAILLYLANKAGTLIPTDPRGQAAVHQWLFWQVGGLGPMAGQQAHFRRSAPAPIPYAIERYTTETTRLFGVLNTRLADTIFLAGEHYSVADIATYTWAAPYTLLNQDIDTFPHVERWLDAIASRPATRRAYEIARSLNPNAPQPPPPRAARRSGCATSFAVATEATAGPS